MVAHGVLVVPATWEAEAGESLEPGRQGAEIVPLYSSLVTERDSVLKKKYNMLDGNYHKEKYHLKTQVQTWKNGKSAE